MRRRNLLQASGVGLAAAAVGVSASPAAARGTAAKSRPTRVHILVYDGAEEQDFIGPRDVFGHAAHVGGTLRTSLVRPGGPGEVTCAFGTRIVVEQGWNPTEADILVIPGGGWGDPEGPGVHRLRENAAVLRDLRRAPVGHSAGGGVHRRPGAVGGGSSQGAAVHDPPPGEGRAGAGGR
ncbi:MULTISPECIES: DJ-1/PfpI family protein [Streptomyces]|uniref:DJ-1/PfpI family protein n=2 Tax=Streptomyces TaxID=1883 RepID=A0ABU2R9V1_9ACTN|nr:MULTISPECIES: DJ-1/PfpI family protein [unclassified Streptomyces]MDT0413477.1 DJ-1/PfpI family protein [Streptomyces sp. DSM 41979]MYQ61771.1 hypothetical protein [Streptomyces sp. SID4926]SCD75603.1 Putative intracellular protease/amidase [Streptomyces sp. DfronAA-171]